MSATNQIITESGSPYYSPHGRDAAIEALEARNANLQRTVVKLLQDRIKVCPECRERYEVQR